MLSISRTLASPKEHRAYPFSAMSRNALSIRTIAQTLGETGEVLTVHLEPTLMDCSTSREKSQRVYVDQLGISVETGMTSSYIIGLQSFCWGGGGKAYRQLSVAYVRPTDPPPPSSTNRQQPSNPPHPATRPTSETTAGECSKKLRIDCSQDPLWGARYKASRLARGPRSTSFWPHFVSAWLRHRWRGSSFGSVEVGYKNTKKPVTPRPAAKTIRSLTLTSKKLSHLKKQKYSLLTSQHPG